MRRAVCHRQLRMLWRGSRACRAANVGRQTGLVGRVSVARVPVRASHQAFLAVLQGQLDEARAAGTLKVERIITSPQARRIAVEGTTTGAVNFCANNYLGLANHPTLLRAAADTLASHGFGLSSVRFICGTQDIHRQLETQLAHFHGMEDAILYGSCFDANGGIFEALLGPEDAVISDELNHASIIDGVRLCKAQRHRYGHRNMAELEQVLRDTAACRTRLIVTDGVFSMDGALRWVVIVAWCSPDMCALFCTAPAQVRLHRWQRWRRWPTATMRCS